MHRRHFIKTAGLSLGAILLSDDLFAIPFGKGGLLALPDEATAVINNQMVVLLHRGHDAWENQDVLVQLSAKRPGTAIEISAPKAALSSVTLRWKMATQNPVPKVLNDQWERTYGDVSWHKSVETERLPWYFMEYNGQTTNGFGVKTGAAAFCYWQIGPTHLSLTLDTRSGGNGVRLGNRTLHAADIVTMKGKSGDSPFRSLRRFCQKMCDRPRMPTQPVYGINDWYFAYGNNSEALILEHTRLLVDAAGGLKNRPFSVIDAGWFESSPLLPGDCCWGDNMDTPNAKFGDMGRVAEKIRDVGMRPGIWTRPLCASVKDAKNRLLPAIKGREDAKQPILDPTIPENLERVKSYFQRYNEWGYEMVKFDFTTFDIFGRWGFQMADGLTESNWTMHDDHKTNAESIGHLYQSIREAAGDTYLIGCNTISHLSAGLFELNRIGDDTSGKEWARTRKMGVNTLAFRAAQHGTFYATDADCVGLTPQVPWEKNKKWMQLVAESGTPLFISAQPEAVGAEQMTFIKNCFQLASQDLPVGEPLDWLETPLPQKWKLNGQVRTFNWD